MNKKYYALDIAKFISAFLVIAIHTQPLQEISEMGNLVFVQVIARLAVPLFFIISGYLFFVKLDDEREWNDYVHTRQLKRYVLRLLKLYLIWSVLYLPFNYLLMKDGGISIVDLLRYVRDFFLTGSYYHLWFLPSLIVAVVGVYVLRLHFSAYQTIGITALLYAIGMLGNVYDPIISNVPVASTILNAYNAVFVTTRNGIFFGMFFIAISAVLAKSHNIVNRSKTLPLLGFVISFIGLVLECLFLVRIDCMQEMTSMYIMVVPCVISLFLWLLALDLRKRDVFIWMRKASLLIYVSHLMFIVILQGVFPTISLLALYLLTCVLSLVFASVILCIANHLTIFKHLYA